MRWDYYVDDWAHKLHVPRFIRRHICDWFDHRLEPKDGWAKWT